MDKTFPRDFRNVDARSWHGNIPMGHKYTMGVAGEEFFKRLRDKGEISATLHEGNDTPTLPPRLFDTDTFAPVDKWVKVGPGGTVETFTVYGEGKEQRILAVISVDDLRQTLYREAQLALRAVIGARDLDDFLAAKDAVGREVEEILRERAKALGLKIVSVGIRDVILPGEMKDLMNKVTEAKKAAEANLISRREETAAMRSQANTAKLLADNPTLMRLRELEVLERVAISGDLKVVLGEKGLADRVVNLL